MIRDHGTWKTFGLMKLQYHHDPADSNPNVAIALMKGVTIALSCRAGKIPYNQICFLTSFEPDKVYLGPNRNNEVAIIYCSGPKYPDFIRFPFTCATGTTSCTT